MLRECHPISIKTRRKKPIKKHKNKYGNPAPFYAFQIQHARAFLKMMSNLAAAKKIEHQREQSIN
jgi:hypothetical protein